MSSRGMRHAVRIGALVAVSASLGVGVARASHPPVNPKPVLNPQWSGYAVSAKHVSYTSISGTWTAPVVSCAHGSAPALSAAWVGLGGLTTKHLEQVGVDANCDAKGRASYFAWFEILPDIAHTVTARDRVFAGDTIKGSVKKLGLSLIELRIENQTRHWVFDRKITWGDSDTSSAEWIVEAPFTCKRFSCEPAPLANFGSVTFRDIAAVGNGTPGTLANSGWKTTPINLVPCVRDKTSSRAGGTPSSVSRDGTRFGISWLPDAGRATICSGLSGASSVGVLPDYTAG